MPVPPMVLSMFARLRDKPNSNAAASAPSGFHRPRIIAASAMKPLPADISRPNASPEPTVKTAPPRPASAPPMRGFTQRVRITLMPTVSAALGCSPTDRTRSPHLLPNKKICNRMIAAYIRYTRMFWLNNTGPMMGNSDRNGTGSAGNRNRWFKSGFSVSTVEKKNVVSPSTNTFSTTPTMIWSTQYFTLKNTSSSPTRAPATGAASTPTYGLPTIEATTAAMNAPPSSCPSMAMLITPVRSHITPDRAPKIRGTDSANPPTNSEVSEIVAPAPTQVRKAMMNAAPKIDGGHQPTGSRRTARMVA